MSAYQNLSSNYQVFQGLSNFQREVVYYKNQTDIYSALIDTLLNIFPFRKAAVLLPPPDFHSNINGSISSFQVLCPDRTNKNFVDNKTLEEIEDRWVDFTHRGKKKLVINKTRDWVALPMHGENHIITAIFVGWVKPKTNPLSFAENLSLFISFAEQTTDWLSMFKQKERVLQHISSIYQAVEAISSQSNPRQVIDLFASYARALTDCEKTIFWMEESGSKEYDDDPYPIYSVKGPRGKFPEEEWRVILLDVWSNIYLNQAPVFRDLNSKEHGRAQLICVPVRSGERCLGMLAGIKSNNTYNAQEVKQTLTVLADLSAIAVERSRADMFAEKLLIVDEQKRIANEIHDSISQNLFSIVYSIDSLTKETADILELGYREILNDIKNLSAETARELRALIYRLNPRQDANDSFVEETKNYLDKLSRMNNIKIDYVINGNTEYLNPAMCKAFYRILKESSGNALRHGKCTEINISLETTPFKSILKISDNGKGFDVQSSLDLYSAGNRLGLVNMRELAIALQGTLDIISKSNKGTEVTCVIPTSPVSIQ
ncbi:MAG: GAF domain-containing sensor histidine kinase [Bacillota bacterium]